MSDLPEPDRLAGSPHPRERTVLFGQDAAQEEFLAAARGGRLHHAWLIGGPQGVGKATLAYRIARRLLASAPGAGDAPASLDTPPDHPASRLVAALSHPGLFVLRRMPATDKKAATSTIPVEQVRKSIDLFASTAAGSYRICIVDSAEDLTGPSANALLKVIEEPPPRSLFLIVAHEPRRVMPTIRSRCRRLALRPLEPSAVERVVRSIDPAVDAGALAAAIARSEGSARRALELLDLGKIAILEHVEALLGRLPGEDIPRTLALAERLARREAEEEYGLALDAVQRWISGRIRAHAGQGAGRLAPLVEVCEKIARTAREADRYNLDRRPLILTMFRDLSGAVRALEPV